MKIPLRKKLNNEKNLNLLSSEYALIKVAVNYESK